jgi:hypothetical protein
MALIELWQCYDIFDNRLISRNIAIAFDPRSCVLMVVPQKLYNSSHS